MNQQFSIIVAYSPSSEDEMLDVTDALGEAGCLDGSVGGHPEGMEVIFNREATSLDGAIKSAVGAVESAGYLVKRVELTRESITL
jgi:hypothetical protein